MPQGLSKSRPETYAKDILPQAAVDSLQKEYAAISESFIAPEPMVDVFGSAHVLEMEAIAAAHDLLEKPLPYILACGPCSEYLKAAKAKLLTNIESSVAAALGEELAAVVLHAVGESDLDIWKQRASDTKGLAVDPTVAQAQADFIQDSCHGWLGDTVTFMSKKVSLSLLVAVPTIVRGLKDTSAAMAICDEDTLTPESLMGSTSHLMKLMEMGLAIQKLHSLRAPQTSLHQNCATAQQFGKEVAATSWTSWGTTWGMSTSPFTWPCEGLAGGRGQGDDPGVGGALPEVVPEQQRQRVLRPLEDSEECHH